MERETCLGWKLIQRFPPLRPVQTVEGHSRPQTSSSEDGVLSVGQVHQVL